MKTLIIIDFQKDFISGSLAVPNAIEAEKAIINYIKEHHNDIKDVLFTVDWHSQHHCSFKNNGGIWPVHCVQFSEGAGISDNLINTCIEFNLPINVFKKGNISDEEEYGAFEYIYTGGKKDKPYIIVENHLHQFQYIYTSDIVVCGLAGDYCVKETIKNLLKYKDFNIEILKDGVKSIDDGTTFNNFINENKLKEI